MADIFNSRGGYVAILEGENVIPGRVSIYGNGPFEPQAALISGIDYRQNTSQQFQTSMDTSVYIYVFGDQMGQIVVKGIAFPITCNGSSEGILEVLKFYSQNRASKEATPISVNIGSGGEIRGFLTSISIFGPGVGDDPAGFISQYELGISALPEK